MKRYCLLLLLLLLLTACEKSMILTNEEKNEKSTILISEEKSEESTILINEEKNSIDTSPTYLAEDENLLSVWDYDMAYSLCSNALSEYYRAIWNGSSMNLDTYIDNENLKQYLQRKITYQNDLFQENNLTDNLVKKVETGAREVKYVGADKGFFYIKLDTRIKKDIGSYAEPNEFLVHTVNGRLVIADWYTSGKDSYDFNVRGENQTINNPNLWNDLEWVNALSEPGTTALEN